jgi:hypothetical protein
MLLSKIGIEASMLATLLSVDIILKTLTSTIKQGKEVEASKFERKNLLIFTLHDYLCRKCQAIYKRATETNIWA